MKLRQAVKEGALKLQAAGVNNSEYDSYELMAFVNGMDKTFYLLNGNKEISQDEFNKFNMLIEKRSKRIPLQHIIGEAYFYGRKFSVNENVLIPRQDTEVLVSEVLKLADKQSFIIDMCTGSGCIIISLALEKGLENAIGIDISKKALTTAEYNKKMLDAQKVQFIESNLFENVKIDDKADIIVSNPPYIRSDDIKELDSEVKDHDPMLALDGHDDGLYFYHEITKNAYKYLKKGGYLFYEIGYDQAEDVSGIMKTAGFYDIKVIKDLAGLDRVVKGRI